ncbi:unnamed protein product, partial [Polarella glacialis]
PLGSAVGRCLLLAVRGPTTLAVRHPLLLLLLIKVAEILASWWARRRSFIVGQRQVLQPGDDMDLGLIQGCLLSTENLLNQGRVEKRTLFTMPLEEAMGRNDYLVHMLKSSARQCRQT